MKKLICFLCVVIVIACNLFIVQFCDIEDPLCTVTFTVSAQTDTFFQCFYMTESGQWSGVGYKDYGLTAQEGQKTIVYTFPVSAKAFRIDTGNTEGAVTVSDLKMSCMYRTLPVEITRLQQGSDDVGQITYNDYSAVVNSIGSDPYVKYLFSEGEKAEIEDHVNVMNWGLKVLLLVVMNAVFLLAVKKRSAIYSIIKEMKNSVSVIWRLSLNDLKSRFSSSFLGVVWAFVQPLMTILVFWFVFQVGLRNSDINNIPFILWYAIAFIAWTFFSDTVMSTTNCLREYGYLVRKIQFNVEIIPVVKVISGCVVHILFILFAVFLCAFYRINVTIHWIQVFYYFGCTILLLLGLGWLLSAVSLFVGDVASCVGVIIQIGFWATPIVWNPETMSPAVQTIMKLNPMYYICSGYRDAFINQQWFWERGWTNAYFWIIVLFSFIAGILVFRKLKSQFADVL